MPLDTSTYALALLRLDGRRWNELRRLTAQISTQPAADGSSYLEMGNTKVICTVTGPTEHSLASHIGPRQQQHGDGENAEISVTVSLAGFSSVERKRTGRNDKKVTELQSTMCSTFSSALFLNLYPYSTLSISLHVLGQDGSLLAACINAATLALIDAGVPMRDYICAATSGSTSSYSSNDESADPLLDLNGIEEQELPFLTVGTLGGKLGGGEGNMDDEEEDKVVCLVVETRVQVGQLEGMLAVGVDGCKQVRAVLDRVVRERGMQVLEGSHV
jgi:exosome complex component RRP41